MTLLQRKVKVQIDCVKYGPEINGLKEFFQRRQTKFNAKIHINKLLNQIKKNLKYLEVAGIERGLQCRALKLFQKPQSKYTGLYKSILHSHIPPILQGESSNFSMH